MVDNPIALAIGCYPGRAEQDHDVIRELLDPGLIKEEQITRLRLAPITADEHAVEIFQSAPVSKVRKLAIAKIVWLKGARARAKDFFPQRVMVEIETGHIRRDGLIGLAHLLEP